MPYAAIYRPLAMKASHFLPVCAVAAASLFANVPSTSAVPLSYTISVLSLPVSGSDTIFVNPGATAPLPFSLDNGQSQDFGFFTLSPNPFPISGTSSWTFSSAIDFSDPDIPALASMDLLMKETLVRPLVLFSRANR